MSNSRAYAREVCLSNRFADDALSVERLVTAQPHTHAAKARITRDTLPVMAEDGPRQKGTLRVAATASNGVEADLICQRLAEAGIQATTQRSIGGPEWGVSGGQYIYVEAEHLNRARDILAAPSGISDEDLAAMAEEAASTSAVRSLRDRSTDRDDPSANASSD